MLWFLVDKQGAIAILRTMGASSYEIMAIFMVQGGLIGLTGAFLGLILGVVLSQVVTPLVQTLEKLFGMQFLYSDAYPISYLPSDLHWGDVARVVITALVIGFFATLYRASSAPAAYSLQMPAL